MALPKRMNFRNNSKLPLIPPLIFGKSYCGFCDFFCVLYDPISHEMHVVQQFNMVLPLDWLKTYPKKTLLYHFNAEKALFKVQNLQHKFLDWK